MSLTKASYSMISGSPINVVDFYEATDPDWTNAFERAIYAAQPSLDSIQVFVPPGDYVLSRQIIPRRSLMLTGGGLATTRLRFTNVASVNPVMSGAISLGIFTTLNAYTTNSAGYPTRSIDTVTAGGADQSQIANLAIFIEGTTPPDFKYGIWNSARTAVLNVQLNSCGLKTEAGTRILGSGSVAGNANTSLYHNVNSLYAPEYAFVTDGTDSNAITFDRCTAFIPGVIGFYEAGLLGNLYINCHREGVTPTTTHGYKAINPGDTNNTMFIQCYNEADAVLNNWWDVAPGIAIIGGVTPTPETLTTGKNAFFMPQSLAGYVTNFQFNCAADGKGFPLGSSTVAAARMATNGFFVRAGDGTIGALVRGGDGSYLTRDGIAVYKIQKGAAIANPSGGGTVDTVARTAINLILDRMRAGLPSIET